MILNKVAANSFYTNNSSTQTIQKNTNPIKNNVIYNGGGSQEFNEYENCILRPNKFVNFWNRRKLFRITG